MLARSPYDFEVRPQAYFDVRKSYGTRLLRSLARRHHGVGRLLKARHCFRPWPAPCRLPISAKAFSHTASASRLKSLYAVNREWRAFDRFPAARGLRALPASAPVATAQRSLTEDVVYNAGGFRLCEPTLSTCPNWWRPPTRVSR